MKFYVNNEVIAIDEELFSEVEEMKPKHVLSLGARCVRTFGGAKQFEKCLCSAAMMCGF